MGSPSLDHAGMAAGVACVRCTSDDDFGDPSTPPLVLLVNKCVLVHVHAWCVCLFMCVHVCVYVRACVFVCVVQAWRKATLR
jgi:hypothetical protein